MDAYVYRTYDRDGVLLYVGCTRDPERRFKEHRMCQETISRWFPLMASREITAAMPEAEALALETHWIRTLGPKFNVADAPKRYTSGAAIVAARERIGMQRRTLARHVGVMSQYLGILESDYKTSSSRWLHERLAEALGVELDDITVPESAEVAA